MRQSFPVAGDVDRLDAGGRLSRFCLRRPRLRLNMIVSVDGAASLRARFILVGTGTLGAEGYGPALAPPQRLELAHVLEADGYLFLRYRRGEW